MSKSFIRSALAYLVLSVFVTLPTPAGTQRDTRSADARLRALYTEEWNWRRACLRVRSRSQARQARIVRDMPFLSAIVSAFAEILRRNVPGTWQGFRKAFSVRVGSELKAARKKTGISVEVISKRTKIQVSKLVALEKDDFKNLPTGLYLFSAVRAYAREVHIDPEPIVERLRATFAAQDALDALHAIRSKKEQSKLLRNGAIVLALC